MKIRFGENDNWQLNTDGQSVTITEAFVGPLLKTSDGEELGICMRDSGFHLQYTEGGVTTDIILNNGNVSVH